MQGRLRSKRLPAKGFFTFFGQTIWERMCDIALAIDGVNDVVFTTGDTLENRLMQPIVEAKGVRFFAGSEDNVLERFVNAIDDRDVDYVIRLTCDNYLVQPALVEDLLSNVLAEGADYGCISTPLSHYSGEVIHAQILRESLASGRYTAEAREHVTWDICRNPKVSKVFLPNDYLSIDHLGSRTLDTVEDFIEMKRLEQAFPGLKNVRAIEVVQNTFPAGRGGKLQSTLSGVTHE